MFMQPGPAQAQLQGLLATADAQQAQGRTTEALATLQQARAVAQSGGNPALTAQVLVATATLQASTGRGGDAMAAMQEAAGLFGMAGDQASQIRAQIQLASLQAAAGQFGAAMDMVQRCLGSASQLADRQLIAETRGAGGQLLLGGGQAQAAAGEFRAGLAVATGLPDPMAQIQLRAFLAVAVFRCGDVAQANALLGEDVRVARALPNMLASAMALGTVCDALVLIQRPLDALTVGQEVLARLQPTGVQPQILQAMIGLANLYALAGHPAEAAQQASQAVTTATGQGGPAAAASALMQLGMMAFQRGDRMAASDLLPRARAQAMTAGIPEPPMLSQMLSQLGL